jgi:hypothetical protein
VFISGAVAEFTSQLGVHVVPGREQHGVNQSLSANNPLNPRRTPGSLLTKTCRTKTFFCPTFFCQPKPQDEWLAVTLRFGVGSSLDPVTVGCLVELAALVGDGGLSGSG